MFRLTNHHQEHFNVNFNVSFNLEYSSCAFSLVDKIFDNIRMHGTTVRKKNEYKMFVETDCWLANCVSWKVQTVKKCFHKIPYNSIFFIKIIRYY
jgi:hypothetical protein